MITYHARGRPGTGLDTTPGRPLLTATNPLDIKAQPILPSAPPPGAERNPATEPVDR